MPARLTIADAPIHFDVYDKAIYISGWNAACEAFWKEHRAQIAAREGQRLPTLPDLPEPHEVVHPIDGEPFNLYTAKQMRDYRAMRENPPTIPQEPES